jgi:hypothetical protein
MSLSLRIPLLDAHRPASAGGRPARQPSSSGLSSREGGGPGSRSPSGLGCVKGGAPGDRSVSGLTCAEAGRAAKPAARARAVSRSCRFIWTSSSIRIARSGHWPPDAAMNALSRTAVPGPRHVLRAHSLASVKSGLGRQAFSPGSEHPLATYVRPRAGPLHIIQRVFAASA